MKNLIRVSLASLLLTGLTAPHAMAQEEKPATKEAAKAPDDSPKVKLLDAGAEPRHKLRYTPSVGDEFTMSMSMKMDQTMEMDGTKVPSQSLPAMLMTMDMKVLEVRPNGDVKYTMVFSKADAEGEKGDRTAEAMRKGLQSVVGLTGTAVVTNRGETTEADFKLPAGADASLAGMVDGMKNSTRQMSAPLPEEAVGTGAKWEVFTKTTTSGMTIDQTATMTLKEINGDAIIVGVDMIQKAVNQKMDSPMGKIDIVSIDSVGHGSIEGTTRSIAPTVSDMSMNSKQEMKMGETQKIKMNMKIDVKLKTVPKKEAAPTEPAKK